MKQVNLKPFEALAEAYQNTFNTNKEDLENLKVPYKCIYDRLKAETKPNAIQRLIIVSKDVFAMLTQPHNELIYYEFEKDPLLADLRKELGLTHGLGLKIDLETEIEILNHCNGLNKTACLSALWAFQRVLNNLINKELITP
jgi:hypothetical protein